MPLLYYDINSLSMTRDAWIAAFGNKHYRRIGYQRVGWGPNRKIVSTVWLGINYDFFNFGVPLIFESLVFERHNIGAPITRHLYAFKEEAVEGHAQLVKKYQYNRAQRRRKGIP